MSPSETKLRDARMEWEIARARWMQAQEDIRLAKFNWDAAQGSCVHSTIVDLSFGTKLLGRRESQEIEQYSSRKLVS